MSRLLLIEGQAADGDGLAVFDAHGRIGAARREYRQPRGKVEFGDIGDFRHNTGGDFTIAAGQWCDRELYAHVNRLDAVLRLAVLVRLGQDESLRADEYVGGAAI